MIQVSPNVYVEDKIPFCNLGLITTNDGIVMIDTPSNPVDAVKWRKEIEGKGKLCYIINTEEHGDHCTNSWFYSGVLITSQETRDKQVKRSSIELIERMKKRDPAGAALMEGFQIRAADISFSGNLDLHLGNHTFNLIPLPGHSTGGIGVFIPEERVIFATDCVFYKAKTWLQECLPEAWFASLERIKSLDVDVIVPGHGSPCDKRYLEEQANIIQKWIDLVKSAIKKGLSEAEAIANISSPDPYPPSVPMPESEINRMSISRLYQLFSDKD